MTRFTKLITIAVIAMLGLTLVDATVVHAQGGTQTTQQQTRAQLLRSLFTDMLDATATALNLDQSAVLQEMGSGGKSLADVIKADSGDLTTIETAAKGPITTDIQKAVTDGTLTQAQGNALTNNINKVLDRLVNYKLPAQADRRLQMLKAAAVGVLVKETAAETSVAQRDLVKQLRDGKSLADIAKANNVDPNAIVTAASKTITNQVSKLVSSGKLTQDQANALTNNLQANLTKLMGMPNPLTQRGQQGKGSAGASSNAEPTSPSAPVPEGTPSL